MAQMNKVDDVQTVPLLQEALAKLDEMSKKPGFPQELRPGLRSARQRLKREISRAKTCRHGDSRARRRALRGGVCALLDLIDQLA